MYAAAAKSLQSCPTLCDPIDGSPPGSAVPGILQAWTLEWVAISFSNAWKWKVKVKSLSHVRLLAIPWTAAYRAPLSMGFSRQEYWSGVPLQPDAKNWLIGKDSDAAKDWRQEEKGTTDGWHHWLDGHECEKTPGVGDGQGSLACCSAWGHKELDTTELNWNILSIVWVTGFLQKENIYLLASLVVSL